MAEPSAAEAAEVRRLLERHPDWKATRVRDWWSVRNEFGILLARNRDIVIAAEIAEGRRRP